MDKISGIIPSSPRVLSVDMKDAAPVRPGTPSFGRPEGVSTLQPGNSVRGSTPTRESGDWRTKESTHAAIAQDLSDKFFINKSPAPRTAAGATASEPASVAQERAPSPLRASAEIEDFSDESSPGLEYDETEDAPMLNQPDGLFPRGSFIDRTA